MTHEKFIEAYDNQSKVEELKHEQEVLIRDCAGKRWEMIQSEIDQLKKEFETI